MQRATKAETTVADMMCGPGLIRADQGKWNSSQINKAIHLIVNHKTFNQQKYLHQQCRTRKYTEMEQLDEK